MLDLHLDLEDHGPSPLKRATLEHALRQAVRAGRLAAGSPVPSSRSLAADLGMARSTVVAAYEQLIAEGYFAARQGSATTVAAGRSVTHRDEDDVMGPTFQHDFRPGEPDASSFPRAEWLRSTRRVIGDADDSSFGYPDPRGVPELRAELAEYLGRTRSVSASSSSIRVYGGIASALGFVAEALRRRGVERIAVEHPHLPFHAQILRLAGLRTVGVGVDDEGLCVEELADHDVGAVLVTPAHQYPVGSTMSPGRRNAVLAWARDNDCWVIEDDYDGEFRYDRRPIGAMQGLDPDRVIYAGTASKSIGPTLRLAWLAVPPGFAADLFTVTHVRSGVSGLDQLVLADFIRNGSLDRHVRTARSRYAERRSALIALLRDIAPWLTVDDHAAGLHLTARIGSEVGDSRRDETAIIEQAATHSIGLFGLRTHHGDLERSGLVVGFSRPAEHAVRGSLEALGGFLASI